jgi:hypothetical protein
MTAKASPKPPFLSRQRRSQCSTALLADDLRRIDQDDQDQGGRVAQLSQISHRSQLALGQAQGLHR